MSGLKDTIELVKDNTEWVFDGFFETLTKPTERYSTPSAIDLIPNVWIFGILSILVGTVLFGASIEMTTGVLSRIVVVTLMCWTLFSAIFHAACKLLGGASTFKRTLAVSIQVFSVAFVLSSFAGFVATRAFEFLQPIDASKLTHGDVLKPVAVCLAVQAVLLVVYATASLRSLHTITGWLSFLVLPLISIAFMLLNLVLFAAVFFSDLNGLNPHT